MKRILLVFLGLGFYSTLAQTKEPSKPIDFSGNWVLDFSETKNPPAGLQSYSMVVNQDQEQLKVETSLQGNLQPAQNEPTPGNYPGGSGGGYPGGRRGGMGGGAGMGRIGMGMPGGGMGRPGGGMPGGRGGQPRREGSQGNVAAYKLYPQSAVYKLGGSESTAQLGDPDQTNAVSKAEWEKDGHVLKLSLRGKEDSGQTRGKIQLRDQWRLSDDAKTLRVDRSIKSPEGSGTLHLVFLRQETRSTGGVAPERQN